MGDTIKTRVQEAIKQLSWFFQSCETLITWGVCIMLCSCSGKNISTGLLSESVGLVSIFIHTSLVTSF